MTSTISTGTLTVTHKESLSLNGSEQGTTNTLTIASVTEVYKRIVACAASVDTTIATFQTTVATTDNALDLELVKYIRVTNLDDSNSVNLSLQIAIAEGGTANSSCTILLEAGRSFIMGSPHDGIGADDDAATVITAPFDLESIVVDPTSNEVDVEIFVASVS